MQSLLEVTDLWRSYQRGAETIHALAGVSLSVQAGEILGIVGRSGSGKTTLLNLIGGLDTPTRGTIRLGIGRSPVYPNATWWWCGATPSASSFNSST